MKHINCAVHTDQFDKKHWFFSDWYNNLLGQNQKHCFNVVFLYYCFLVLTVAVHIQRVYFKSWVKMWWMQLLSWIYLVCFKLKHIYNATHQTVEWEVECLCRLPISQLYGDYCTLLIEKANSLQHFIVGCFLVFRLGLLSILLLKIFIGEIKKELFNLCI